MSVHGLDRVVEGRTGWAVSGSLLTGNTSNTVSLQANFGKASIFTVQVDVTTPDSGAVPQVTISYTVNGVPVSRTIDVAAGASISGVAEAVRVLVTDNTPTPMMTAGNTYPVTITIGTYPRPGGSYPTVTGKYNTAVTSGGGQLTTRVPAGAQGVYVFAWPETGTTIDLEITQATSVGPLFKALQTVGIPDQPIPLVAGAKFVNVINNGSTNVDVTVIFSVDG